MSIIKLSVLDQTVIRKGETAKISLNQTLELAKLSEDLGYTRFWVAEHHNTRGIAGTSPEILISHIATNTSTIRIGSGGVLLPQYSPYKVAENFKLLETLYPNRIDLGIGRSPGGSPATRLALTDSLRKSMNEFPRQISDLQGYLDDSIPDSHPYHNVKAYPVSDGSPELWILGVTHRGARVAAEKGTAFTYGHFINPENGLRAMETYRENFQPSISLKTPKTNVCIFVICAPTQERAEEIAISQDIWLLSVEKGLDTHILPVHEANNIKLTKKDKERIVENRRRMIIGTPKKVREEIIRLRDYYKTEEFMIINNTYDFQEKLQTYRLLAEQFL